MNSNVPSALSMKFAHECRIVVWTFSPPRCVLISPLGDVFSSYGFLLDQSELTHHLLKKGRKEIQILSGGKVWNMLSLPKRCIAQHAGFVGEWVKNDVSFFVIHQYFHPRQEKTVLSKLVSKDMFYFSTSSHFLIAACYSWIFFSSCFFRRHKGDFVLLFTGCC